MSSLRSLIESQNNRNDIKLIPRMSQPHFIALWRTLHDMLTTQPEDQAMYHAIASTGIVVSLE